MGADHHAHCGESADDAAAPSVDVVARRIANQRRKQIGENRADQLVQVLVGRPSGVDEQSRQYAPANEHADIRHDHRAERGAEFLHIGLQLFQVHTHSPLLSE